MTCKLRGRLRKPEKLRGKVTGVRVAGPSGVYIDGDFQGEAQGWYNANLPGLVPVGLWDGAGNRTDANGYYDNNERAPIPDGCYRNGGLVDPYYEAIIKAAEAQGGGLYLFQLEHGQYAGEQVIWQEMGELTPWVPGLSTPQGKTMDLCGSGEFLGQSVSMRRPVDGVFDGVGTWMDASSDAVGGHLHQDRGSAWFAGLEVLTAQNNANILSTTSINMAGGNGIEVRNNNSGIFPYRRVSGAYTTNIPTVAEIGLAPGFGQRVAGYVYGNTGQVTYLDAVDRRTTARPSIYEDTPADFRLRVGARAGNGGNLSHARYTYIAIYTREPTPYEISLHKGTP